MTLCRPTEGHGPLGFEGSGEFLGQTLAFFSGQSRLISVARSQRILEGFLCIPAWMSHPRDHLHPEENLELSADYVEDLAFYNI